MMIRFGFNIRTKTGQRVDNVQIYVSCQIIERREQSVAQRNDTLDVENVIGIISAAPSGDKAGTQ